MGYFDASDLTDVIDDLKELLEEYKDFDSIELVENAEDFQEKFQELLKKAESAASDFVYEYESLEDDKEEAEEKLEGAKGEYNDLLLESGVSNLYDLQKRRVCTDLFKNLSLEELEKIEKQVISERKNYPTSTLSDVETN